MEDIENIFKVNVKQIDIDLCLIIVDELLSLKDKINTREKLTTFINNKTKKYKKVIFRSHLLYVLRTKYKNPPLMLLELLISKSNRTDSGVQVVAILTSPFPTYIDDDGEEIKQEFSCAYDCHMCPKQPNVPRSYIGRDMENKEDKVGEPAVLRAQYNKFDPVYQIHDRLNSYVGNGMVPDKLEVIVLGGTWSSYPKKYQDQFICSIYYAANTFMEDKRPMKDLETEKKINENTKCHVIGLTLETRPDQINKVELIRFRKFGVTRVQLGVQHTNDRLLRRINRMCYDKHTIRAIKMLKDNCFKVDIHLMPDLPQPLLEEYQHEKDATNENIDYKFDVCEEDKIMFYKVINYEEYQADQWKIYPCMVVPWTKLKEEYEKGLYKPYGEEKDSKLIDLLIDVKSQVKPWIRLNRIVRDIPSQHIEGGMSDVSGRQTLERKMKKLGLNCNCIRCREIGKRKVDLTKAEFMIRTYNGSGGIEHFLSYEIQDGNNPNILIGFLRLRFNNPDNEIVFFKELEKCAFIRELHVYGNVVGVGSRSNATQHKGFGTKLVQKACEIAFGNGYKKIAVISGIGVKNYYRRFGFEDEDYFMTKKLDSNTNDSNNKNNKQSDINHNITLQNQKIIMIVVVIFLFIKYLFTFGNSPRRF